MLELIGISRVRRPDGGRWNDGAAYWFMVWLADPQTHVTFNEEAPVEDIQSYRRFQAFVAREFGIWYRYPLAEKPGSGDEAWSAAVASVWGRTPAG